METQTNYGNYKNELLKKSIRSLEIIEIGRKDKCPQNWSLSDWGEYKAETFIIKEVRVSLSELYMLN